LFMIFHELIPCSKFWFMNFPVFSLHRH
jgi:hypothetical protein